MGLHAREKIAHLQVQMVQGQFTVASMLYKSLQCVVMKCENWNNAESGIIGRSKIKKNAVSRPTNTNL